jgi:hypothetical protein
MLQASTISKFFRRTKAADFSLEAVNITKDTIPHNLIKHIDVSDERAASIFWSKDRIRGSRIL